MNIEYLIQLMENRLKVLGQAKDQAFMSGDLERINTLDADLNGIQDTIAKLRLLVAASTEAATMNTTMVEAMKIQPKTTTDGSIECLKDYDITDYATDPLHEQKIADILTTIGPMTAPETIDAYITNEALGSPLTGAMIVVAAQKYAVDVRLMLALMELDSRFGTAGVAVETLNPGNIGNTGTTTRTYESWADGVTAVAEWLSRHRIEKILPPLVTPETATSTPQTTATSTAPVATPTPEPTIEPSPSVPFTDTATTTPNAVLPDETASTTPSYSENATTTAPVITPLPVQDPISTTTPSTDFATSSSPVIDLGTSSTTPAVSPTVSPTPSPTPAFVEPAATSTPDITATSTQARSWFSGGGKRKS